ncbi:protein of unknown function [Ruminococcaceae bacterium BL-6]|nr:protein of unknown function [Ruminococcaceae bacterium BL-6]
MKKFVVTFMSSASIIIDANTEEEAKENFDKIPDEDLLNELDGNGIEMTDIFEEDD